MSKAAKLWLKVGAGITLLFGALLSWIGVSSWTATGKRAEGERLQRMQRSARWNGERFTDPMPRTQASMLKMATRYFTGGSAFRVPAEPLPIQMLTAGHFTSETAAGLRVTWLGHSTLIVEIDGKRLLLDPVWGERASPLSWAGPKRFYAPPLPLAQLPEIDAIVISHDHYDHLDTYTVQALAKKSAAPFIVPLGVGAHLEYWGVPAARIVELDWWQEFALDDLRLVATPARHFSGRSMTFSDADATLWSGWALLGPRHRAYYSGDTAMFPGFTEIGERLGPFDVTLIESGAYNSMWPDVHLGPEQAVEAHQMVRGKTLIPVHWGLFDLALHGWTEPVERVLAKAQAVGVRVVTPLPGGSVDLESIERTAPRWWPELPWVAGAQDPVISTGLVGSLQGQ